MGKLDGKVAVITGGGRGIGRAIAEGFRNEGARVVVTAARERQEIDAFATSCRADQALANLQAMRIFTNNKQMPGLLIW